MKIDLNFTVLLYRYWTIVWIKFCFFCRLSFNTIKICLKYGMKQNDYDANGLMIMKKLHRSHQWSLPIWMSSNWISEVRMSSKLFLWSLWTLKFMIWSIGFDFKGDNVDCWMEIQSGKGPWAPPVSGIVPIGSTLTLVVAINDYRGKIGLLYLFGYLLQKKIKTILTNYYEYIRHLINGLSPRLNLS